MKFKLIIFLIESYLVAANIDPGITFSNNKIIYSYRKLQRINILKKKKGDFDR